MNQNNNPADSGASLSDVGLGVVCEHGQLKRSCPLCEKDAEIERLRNLVRNFANAVEANAFAMDAPNEFTPRFIQLVCTARSGLTPNGRLDFSVGRI